MSCSPIVVHLGTIAIHHFSDIALMWSRGSEKDPMVAGTSCSSCHVGQEGSLHIGRHRQWSLGSPIISSSSFQILITHYVLRVAFVITNYDTIFVAMVLFLGHPLALGFLQ